MDRPNIETSVMDTEPDTQGPKDDDLNLQIGLVGNEGVPERDLVNMDSEEARGNGSENETILPGDLGELGGERYSYTRAGPTQGGEKKRKLGRPETETSDRDPETDNTQILNNDELNIQPDVVEDGEATERNPANMDSKVTRGKGAEDATTLYEGRSHNDTSAETTGEPTESNQLRHNVGQNEWVTRIAQDSGDDTAMIEHLAEGSEVRCHNRATATVNMQQHTKNPSETIAHSIQAAREQEADELEASPGKKILERDQKIATGGDQVDIDPETTGDRCAKSISVERRRRRSNNEGQGVQPPAPPTKIAEDIKERNHVSKTMALLSSPPYDKYTNIVSAFGTDVTREDFERLQTRAMFNEGSINWMMRWWSGQVNGRFGSNPPPPQSNPHMPRCFFASTFWYTRMTSDGGISYDNVKRWTKKVDILRHYDLMIIPINIRARNHWVLAVINLNKKNTVIYDSINTDALRPPQPEAHAHLKEWLTREHQERKIPFDAQVWKAVRGQQTPQQGNKEGVDVDCGVFVLAFAMYLSTNLPLEFSQTDIPNLRNWIAQTMISFGIGNTTFAPTRDVDETGTYASNMDRWTFLVKDFASCPTGSKRKDGYITTPPRRRLTQTPPTIPPPEATCTEARRHHTRKAKSKGIPDKNPNANQLWQPPPDAPPRGIRNMGHSCATNTVLQLWFHIMPLGRILQDRLPQPPAFLTSALNSYTTGNGPLDLQDLIPIPATISRPEDAGELLSHFLNLIRVSQLEQKHPMPTTLSLPPANTLLLSFRSTVFTSPRPRADSENNMVIFQIDRADLKGRKNATTTQFPLKLDRACQHMTGCGSKGAEYELQAVVVHRGNSKKGHYIIFLKPAGGPHWALYSMMIPSNGWRRRGSWTRKRPS